MFWRLICLYQLLSLLVSSLAWSQTYVTSQGSTSYSTTTETLTVADSVVIFTRVNGIQTSGSLGTLSFTTPILETGDFQTGGTFDSGGEFVIDSPGLVDYVGNFQSGEWVESTVANGTHFYTLQGPLTSMEGTGAFVCTTVNLGEKGNKSPANIWVRSAKIENCSVYLDN